MRFGFLVVPLLAVCAGAAPAFQAPTAPTTPPAGPRTGTFQRPDNIGQISEIKGDVFTIIMNRQGTMTGTTVTIPASIPVTRRRGEAASRADLTVGTRIGVYGESKPDGTFVVSRVVILPARTGRGGGVTPPAPNPAPAPAAVLPAVVYPEITVDTTGAPDLAGFANRARAICEAMYPQITAYLKSDGFTAPRTIKFIFRDMDGVAYTAGTEINFAAKYFREHQDDYGAAVHEMTHVIQHYTRGNNPGWLVEALDDYVRFYRYEPSINVPHANPDRVGDTPEAYRVGAQFLDWTQARYDKDLVPQLNKAMREGTYSDDLWKTRTGKTLSALWTEWKSSLRAIPTSTASVPAATGQKS